MLRAFGILFTLSFSFAAHAEPMDCRGARSNQREIALECANQVYGLLRPADYNRVSRVVLNVRISTGNNGEFRYERVDVERGSANVLEALRGRGAVEGAQAVARITRLPRGTVDVQVASLQMDPSINLYNYDNNRWQNVARPGRLENCRWEPLSPQTVTYNPDVRVCTGVALCSSGAGPTRINITCPLNRLENCPENRVRNHAQECGNRQTPWSNGTPVNTRPLPRNSAEEPLTIRRGGRR